MSSSLICTRSSKMGSIISSAHACPLMTPKHGNKNDTARLNRFGINFINISHKHTTQMMLTVHQIRAVAVHWASCI
ncbi:hypothetical protein [Moraxella lacunata]|uniref:hypothetical protein n=1 Tax=Moraxella lacunata TaxID=477 RepID=UPI003EE048DB